MGNGSPDRKQRCTLSLGGGVLPPSASWVLTVRMTWLENWGHIASRWLKIPNFHSHYVNGILTTRSLGNHALENKVGDHREGR